MKARILYYDHYPRLSGGEISLLTFLTYLDRDGYDPLFVYNEEGEFVEKVRALGIECIHLPLPAAIIATKRHDIGAPGVIRRVRALWPAVRQLRAIIKQRDVALLHTNSLKANIIGGLAALGAVSCVWHQRDILTGKIALLYKIAAKLLPTRVICISQVVQDSLGLAKCVRIYNGIKDDFAAASRPAVRDAAKLTVTMIGRIAEWKNQKVFIEAAKGVGAQFNIAGTAMFPGDSVYEARLRADAPANVAFLGFVDTAQTISDSDIIVHCSKEPEPFGMVIVEAMAFKKPVVASKIGAPPEILGDAGLLFNPVDAAELEEKITMLIRDPEARERLGRRGYERFREHFTGSREANEIMAVYGSLLSGRG